MRETTARLRREAADYMLAAQDAEHPTNVADLEALARGGVRADRERTDAPCASWES